MENEIVYNLEFLEKDNIFGNYTVHLCCFSIYDNKYILYLSELIDDKLYFPHYNSKNPLHDSKKYLDILDITGYKYMGYKLHNSQCYLFFELETNFKYDKLLNTQYYFITIYEIVFEHKCFRYMIDSSIYTLFFNYPLLIYLYKNKKQLYIPEVAYYPTDSNNINYNLYIGLDENQNLVEVYNLEQYTDKYLIRTLVYLENYKVLMNTSNIKSRKIGLIDNYKTLSGIIQ